MVLGGGQDSVMVTWGLWEGVPRGRRGFFFGVILQNEFSFGEGEGQGREGTRLHHWG